MVGSRQGELTIPKGSHRPGKNQHDAQCEALHCRFYICTSCTLPCQISPLECCKMTFLSLSLGYHGNISLQYMEMNTSSEMSLWNETLFHQTNGWMELLLCQMELFIFGTTKNIVMCTYYSK